MDSLEDLSAAIARNLRNLRAERRWALETLAARSGVSKGMLVQIEQGRTNPSIATLCRIANALGVTVPRLAEVGEAPAARVVRADQTAALWRTAAGSVARLLLGVDSPALCELWDWSIAAREAYDGDAHPAGTHEMLYVLEGALTLRLERSSHRVERGEAVLLRADRAHGYANEGAKPLRFVMAVVEPRPSLVEPRREEPLRRRPPRGAAPRRRA